MDELRKSRRRGQAVALDRSNHNPALSPLRPLTIGNPPRPWRPDLQDSYKSARKRVKARRLYAGLFGRGEPTNDRGGTELDLPGQPGRFPNRQGKARGRVRHRDEADRQQRDPRRDDPRRPSLYRQLTCYIQNKYSHRPPSHALSRSIEMDVVSRRRMIISLVVSFSPPRLSSSCLSGLLDLSLLLLSGSSVSGLGLSDRLGVGGLGLGSLESGSSGEGRTTQSHKEQRGKSVSM
jgi:hypothetical protein